MPQRDPIQGDLQEQVMRAMWKRERGTVEEVRQALPKRYRGAYTTVQTILNRLAERGLLKRERMGKALVYVVKVTEADYLAGSLDRALAGASKEARRAALASLVGRLDTDEIGEVRALAQRIARDRERS
jgi:predicted transcriptional regulator